MKLIKKEDDGRESSTNDVHFNAKLEQVLKTKLKDMKKPEEEKIEKINSLDFTCKKLPKPKYNEPTRALMDGLRMALDNNYENQAIDILKKNQIAPYIQIAGENLVYLAHEKGMRKLHAYLTDDLELLKKEFPLVQNDAVCEKILSAFLSYDSQGVIDIIKGYGLALNACVAIGAMSQPLLYHAVQYNMVPLIKYLLDRGANPDIDPEPLLNRLLDGYFIKGRKWNESADEAIALLIKAGAPLQTSSIEHVKTNNVDIIRCLVEKNSSELNSFSALLHAINRGNPEVVKYIVEQARAQEPSFHVSSYWHLTEVLQVNSYDRANDVEIFFYLLNEIQSQVPKVEILKRDLDHMLWQALLYYADFMPLIEKLVELGANVNPRKPDSYSPLMLGLGANGLSGRQRESLIRLLLDRGAKVEQEHIEWAHEKNFHRLAHFLETN
jgi:ankyrin repeat protein